jgi:predicted nucleic acid-binding protein
LPTSAEPLLLDTSAAIALVSPGHEKHSAVRTHVHGRRLGLAGHAELETYSVLTRLPAPRRLTPASALRLIRANFPETRRLPPARAARLLDELAETRIAGGSTYDALVALAARHAGLLLTSTDARAAGVYRSLRVEFTLL